MTATYTYESTWRDSQKVSWRVEDLIGPDKPMNFDLPFLPESLVRAADSDCLNLEQQLILNHIRANSYLHLFILVEAFIIPMVMERVKQMGYGNIFATQAQAYRWAFLCAGVGHPNFLQVLERISSGAKERAVGLTKALSY